MSYIQCNPDIAIKCCECRKISDVIIITPRYDEQNFKYVMGRLKTLQYVVFVLKLQITMRLHFRRLEIHSKRIENVRILSHSTRE